MNKLVLLFAAGAFAAACDKKPTAAAPDAAAAAKTGTTAAPTPAPTPTPTPTPAPTATAEGGAVGALTEVNDCPKSLEGGEEVARTIKKECGPVRVTGQYQINGTLTLEAGAVLKLDEGAEIVVGYNKPSKIIAKGTAADPVLLTASGDQVPGFWKGVSIYNHGNRSRLEGVVIEWAGSDHGAIFIAGTDVVVKGTTVRNAKGVGLRLEDGGSVAELDGNTFEKAGTTAMSIPAAAVGSLGETNKLDADAVIEVRGTPIDTSARWKPAGAPYLFTGDTNVNGKTSRAVIEILPGTELRFADGARLTIGYSSTAGLTAAGTAEKPIRFTSAAEKKVGAWTGVRIYGSGNARFEHAVFEYGGAEEDQGAISADGEAEVSVKSTTFTQNRAALVLGAAVKLVAYENNKHAGDEKRSVHLHAPQVGGLGAGNTFEGDAEKIEIQGGNVASAVTWLPQPVPFEVLDDVNVVKGGALTLSPGIELRFREGAQLTVGYSENATLKAVGTAEKPIRLRGVREEEGGWDGVELHSNTRDTVLENVEVAHTGGAAGVMVHGEGVVKLTNVTCVKCANAALTYECPSKVTAADVKAGEGTAAAEKKPEGCPQ